MLQTLSHFASDDGEKMHVKKCTKCRSVVPSWVNCETLPSSSEPKVEKMSSLIEHADFPITHTRTPKRFSPFCFFVAQQDPLFFVGVTDAVLVCFLDPNSKLPALLLCKPCVTLCSTLYENFLQPFKLSRVCGPWVSEHSIIASSTPHVKPQLASVRS